MKERIVEISRRGLATLGGMSLIGFFLPSMAYGDSAKHDCSVLDSEPKFNCTLETLDGRVVLDTSLSNARSMTTSEDGFYFRESKTTNVKDGAITVDYTATLCKSSGIQPFDTNYGGTNDGIADLKISVTYYFTNGKAMVRVESGTATIKALNSMAYINSRGMTLSQGPIGENVRSATFSSESYTIVTNFSTVPYAPTDLQYGTVLNGGMCDAEVGVSGMTPYITRATYTF